MMSYCSEMVACLIAAFVPLERSGQFRFFVFNVLVHAPASPVNSCALGYGTTSFLACVIYYCVHRLCISLGENKYFLSMHSISSRYLRVFYLHFKRHEVKGTAGHQALLEECFQCSHASWPSQMGLYSPPKAHLNEYITIPFGCVTLTCTANPTHFVNTDTLNIFILIFQLSFVFMSSLDTSENQY